MNGPKRQTVRMPTARPRECGASCTTSHAIAMFCIQVPATDVELAGEEEAVVAVAPQRGEGPAPTRGGAASLRGRLEQLLECGERGFDRFALLRRESLQLLGEPGGALA